jgi:hypothetical protein
MLDSIQRPIDGSVFGVYFQRLRRLTWSEALRAAIPRKYDFFLFEANRESLAAVPAPTTPLPVVIKHYDSEHRSGVREMDCRLRGRIEGYGAFVNGVLAHRVYCFWDCPRLRQFGLDPKAPLIGDSYTAPAFRNKHLQAVMRRYVVEDLLSREGVVRVYGKIRPDNLISQRGNRRAGSRPIARLQGIKALGMVFRRRMTVVSV